MGYFYIIALLGLLAVTGSAASGNDRKLSTIGPDDLAAVGAVGNAAIHGGIAIKKAAKKIAIAKKREAFVDKIADKKVAIAVAHGNPMRIAKAVMKATEMKMDAKHRTAKVVGKAMAKVVATKVIYGGKAALAIGNAAFNDAATFAPLLAGVAPAMLPVLATGLVASAPAGFLGALSTVAKTIGGALLGSNGIGLAGPDLLANRVAGLLPEDLLGGLGGLIPGMSQPATATNAVANAGSNDLFGSIVKSLPPSALDAVLGFLNSNPAVADNLPSQNRNGDLIIPVAAMQALVQGLSKVMGDAAGNTTAVNFLGLPNLPSEGLPFPLSELSNLMGVLPRIDLMNVLRSLPRNPLAALLQGLPLGLMGV
eukprot:gene2118-2437_t